LGQDIGSIALVRGAGHREIIGNNTIAEVRRSSIPDEQLKVGVRINTAGDVPGRWVIRVFPCNKAHGNLAPIGKQELHGWEDGVGWVIKALPYNVHPALKDKIPRVEQYGEGCSASQGEIACGCPMGVSF